MSWAAHQFEVYAVQAHLPQKMRGKVRFWGIWLGDFTPDFLAKFWVYGITTYSLTSTTRSGRCCCSR